MDYLQRGYGPYWACLRESPLDQSELEPSSSTYRLWWIPAHYRPMVVRLLIFSDGSGRVCAKEGELGRGPDPGPVIQDWEKILSAKEIQEFLALLTTCDFWQQPTLQPVGGLDGFSWILEGLSKDRYHVVDRRCPPSGPHREACLMLMSLAGLELHGGKPCMRGTWFAFKDST